MTNPELRNALSEVAFFLEAVREHVVIVTFDNDDNPVYNELSAVYVDDKISEDFPRRVVLKLTTERTL